MAKRIVFESCRIAVVGSVGSSERISRAIVKNGLDLVGIAGRDPEGVSGISGYVDLGRVAEELKVPYNSFKNLNEERNVAKIKEWNPDILFIVGISQLAKREIMSIAKLNIGFHPTKLPVGRGRAPLAWVVSDRANAAATFFELTDSADDGAIIAQIPVEVEYADHAREVSFKIHEKIDEGVKYIADSLKKDASIELAAQDEGLATYNGIRRPFDGCVNWEKSFDEIFNLIRSTSEPYPCAYTYLPTGEKVLIKRASPVKMKIRGVAGRVLLVENGCPIIQTGTAPILLNEVEADGRAGEKPVFKVGDKCGINYEKKILELENKIEKLEALISKIPLAAHAEGGEPEGKPRGE